MKKFFIGLLKAAGYFGIYLGAQFLITYAFMFYYMITVIVDHSIGYNNLSNPAILNQFLNVVTDRLLGATMPITIISGLVTIGVICLLFALRKKKVPEALCLRKISGGAVVSAALMGLGFNYLMGLLFLLLPEKWLSSYEEASDAAFEGEFWLVAIAVAIMAPLVEEIVFRGLIYTRLKKGMPVAAATVITSVWFGVMHGHPLWIAFAALFGLLMIWIFERTQSLFGSMAFHFGCNLLAVISMALPEDTPDWVGFVMLGVGVSFSAIGLFWFLKIPKAVNALEGEEPVVIPADAEAAPATEEKVVGTEAEKEEATDNFK